MLTTPPLSPARETPRPKNKIHPHWRNGLALPGDAGDSIGFKPASCHCLVVQPSRLLVVQPSRLLVVQPSRLLVVQPSRLLVVQPSRLLVVQPFRLLGQARRLHHNWSCRSLSLAIIEPQSLPAGSEFGWSLSPQDAEVGLVPLSDLLCQCGVRWVKSPLS